MNILVVAVIHLVCKITYAVFPK